MMVENYLFRYDMNMVVEKDDSILKEYLMTLGRLSIKKRKKYVSKIVEYCEDSKQIQEGCKIEETIIYKTVFV